MEIEGFHLHARRAPERNSLLDTDYRIDLGTLDERKLILVNINRFMTSSDMGRIDKRAA
jgi:hypothetical protein